MEGNFPLSGNRKHWMARGFDQEADVATTTCERPSGRWRDIVRYSGDGRVAGLAIRPASPRIGET